MENDEYGFKYKRRLYPGVINPVSTYCIELEDEIGKFELGHVICGEAIDSLKIEDYPERLRDKIRECLRVRDITRDELFGIVTTGKSEEDAYKLPGDILFCNRKMAKVPAIKTMSVVLRQHNTNFKNQDPKLNPCRKDFSTKAEIEMLIGD